MKLFDLLDCMSIYIKQDVLIKDGRNERNLGQPIHFDDNDIFQKDNDIMQREIVCVGVTERYIIIEID